MQPTVSITALSNDSDEAADAWSILYSKGGNPEPVFTFNPDQAFLINAWHTNPIIQPLKTHHGRYTVTWAKKFEQRQEYKHAGEDAKVEPVGDETKIDAFFAQPGSTLSPRDYTYTALRDFLHCVRGGRLEQPPISVASKESLALVNDLRDTTGWKEDEGKLHFTRNWKEYEMRPPTGEDRYFELLDVWRLYGRLKEN
ncbi:MAG: hypothetical protein LQ347_003227, partial [Umbilicaria vellea]